MKKSKQRHSRTNAVKKVAPARTGTGTPVMSKLKLAAVTLATVSFFVIAGIYTYYALSDYIKPRSSEYFKQAMVQILEEDRELGTMLVSDERSAEFVLRNVGGTPLEISQVRTSCMCTLAQVIIDGEQSPLFNMEMHNSPSVQRWNGIVEPGLTATIQVIYKPSLMPVQGSIARNVKFNTNDPTRPVVELGIHATVR